MHLRRLILTGFPYRSYRFLALQLLIDAMRPRMTEQGIISSKSLCAGDTRERLFTGMTSDKPRQVILFRKRLRTPRTNALTFRTGTCPHSEGVQWR
jgi:hypothetical protein